MVRGVSPTVNSVDASHESKVKGGIRVHPDIVEKLDTVATNLHRGNRRTHSIGTFEGHSKHLSLTR